MLFATLRGISPIRNAPMLNTDNDEPSDDQNLLRRPLPAILIQALAFRIVFPDSPLGFLNIVHFSR